MQASKFIDCRRSIFTQGRVERVKFNDCLFQLIISTFRLTSEVAFQVQCVHCWGCSSSVYLRYPWRLLQGSWPQRWWDLVIPSPSVWACSSVSLTDECLQDEAKRKTYISKTKTKKKSPVSGVHAHNLRTARRHFSILFFFSMKPCPIAAKIAGSIGTLPCCVLNDYFAYRGMNVCTIWEASLNSHHTLCVVNLVWFQ